MGLSMRNFLRSERGYVLILTLIFMPVFIGIGLLVIDIGRGNNAQQDHQAAADALALAGARELNGQADSIDRAKAAMAAISNSVSFLSVNPSNSTQTLTYTPGATAPFNVIFLKALPTVEVGDPPGTVDDDKPITLAFAQDNVADNGTEARFVYVFSRSDSLRSFFFNPFTRTTEDFPVGAVAVATLSRSTCDLAPIFMCNPFVASGGTSAKDKLLNAFSSGSLHGRMVKLDLNPSNSQAGPGNVGFLRVSGNGANALSEALAGKPYPECVTLNPTVETQPGAVTGALDGFNTRFDIYPNGNPNGDLGVNGLYPPALNVRKGWTKANGTSGCVTNPANFNSTATPVFSDNQDPADASELGASYTNVMRKGDWNFAVSVTVPVATGPNQSTTVTYAPYWPTMYPTFAGITFSNPITAQQRQALRDRISSDPSKDPSRYDVYQYEMTHDINGNAVPYAQSLAATVVSPGGERGFQQCYQRSPAPVFQQDRRTLFVAVVDCTNPINSGAGAATLTPDLLAKVFLINPLDAAGNKPGSRSFDFEFVDVSERGNGDIAEYIRDDAVLVR